MEPVTIRLRINYQKSGRLRFLSHLELIGTLERIVRRASLPFALTQGFSPRMKLAFCLPLPVGIGGENELFDVYLNSFIDLEEAKLKLENASPSDIIINSVSYVPTTWPSLCAYYVNACYRVDLSYEHENGSFKDLASILSAFREENEITFLKKEAEKTLILDEVFFREPHLVQDVTSENSCSLKIYLKPSVCGSLRPEVFTREFTKRAQDSGYKMSVLNITREEQYPQS